MVEGREVVLSDICCGGQQGSWNQGNTTALGQGADPEVVAGPLSQQASGRCLSEGVEAPPIGQHRTCFAGWGGWRKYGPPFLAQAGVSSASHQARSRWAIKSKPHRVGQVAVERRGSS